MQLRKADSEEVVDEVKAETREDPEETELQRVMIIMIGDEDNWFEDKNENKDCGIMPLLLGQRQLLSSIPRQ